MPTLRAPIWRTMSVGTRSLGATVVQTPKKRHHALHRLDALTVAPRDANAIKERVRHSLSRREARVRLSRQKLPNNV